MFVGLSLDYASNVPLVLQVDTGFISPDFNVILDDWFTTVTLPEGMVPDATWENLFTNSHYQYFFDEDDPLGLPADWQVPINVAKANYMRRHTEVEAVALLPAVPLVHGYVPPPPVPTLKPHPLEPHLIVQPPLPPPPILPVPLAIVKVPIAPPPALSTVPVAPTPPSANTTCHSTS